MGCKKCECDPGGIVADYPDYSSDASSTVLCDPVNGQCTCKEYRDGQKCDYCIVGFFLVLGSECLKCGCDPAGTVAGTICNKNTGECVCKIYNGIGGSRCNDCSPEFYGFSPLTGSYVLKKNYILEIIILKNYFLKVFTL